MSQRNRNKIMSKKRGKTKDDKNKNQFDKMRKCNKTLKKAKMGGKKNFDRRLKKNKPKIKVLTHELLASTLSWHFGVQVASVQHI
jgi:hypothetical protein